MNDVGRHEERPDSRRRVRISAAVVAIGLLTWLWPIGMGGLMPIGGDVASFSIGLAACLARAIAERRVPFWNDLWGYGFPGLAESQLGVFYLPNLLLYGLFPVEAAYAAGLVIHTIWAGLGAAWSARVFGAGVRGGVVAGLAWGSCGFFQIHVPHQWGATTASWMPWAWGLAWMTAQGRGGRRAPILLAAVLAAQIFPGHFQIAFLTQISVILLAGLGVAGRSKNGVSRHRRAAAVAVALGVVAPLTLAQIGPTFELARLASTQRTVEYLSAFATPPTHLIGYVAPGLFHESPLWRPLAWDAFHAMPEEHRTTIGLVPLLLAWLAIRGGAWRDAAGRALIAVFLAATYFSFGPYAPGFETLCGLPGFSFFRAPARWGAAAMLALAILAGRGVDAWPMLVNPGRRVRMFVVFAAAWIVAAVLVIELCFAANESQDGRPAWPQASAALDRVFMLGPWKGDPPLSRRIADAAKPLDDARVASALARQGRPAADRRDRTLSLRRHAIYGQELGPTAVALTLLMAASFLATSRKRLFEVALAAIMIAEAGYWSRQRRYDLGPIRSLADQSVVLGRMAERPRGTRVVDASRNLPMRVGVGAVEAYRTLDLPIAVGLTRIAALPPGPPEVAAALRALGAGLKVVGEADRADLAGLAGWDVVAEVRDPVLLGWEIGADLVRVLGDRAPTKYTLLAPKAEPARAWLVSNRDAAALAAIGDDPRAMLTVLAEARPLAWRSDRPERVDIDAEGPGVVVYAQLDYPRWRAVVDGKAMPIRRVLGGWQGVEVGEAGAHRVALAYDATRDWVCIAASAVAWVGWAWALVWARRRDVRDRADRTGVER